MNTEQKAVAAERLRRDEAFTALIEEIRGDAIGVFVNSAAADTAKREEAHAILRALAAIDGTLSRWVSDQAVRMKGQHRGND